MYVLILSGCSKSDGLLDDPEDMYAKTSEEFFNKYTFNVSNLTGTWTIESVSELESNKVTQINESFTILPFDLNEATEETSIYEYTNADLKLYSATYDDKVRYNNGKDEPLSNLELTLVGKKGDSISKSKVYIFSFVLTGDDSTGLTLSMNTIESTNGKMSGIGTIILTHYENGEFKADHYSGTITLSKK